MNLCQTSHSEKEAADKARVYLISKYLCIALLFFRETLLVCFYFYLFLFISYFID